MIKLYLDGIVASGHEMGAGSVVRRFVDLMGAMLDDDSNLKGSANGTLSPIEIEIRSTSGGNEIGWLVRS